MRKRTTEKLFIFFIQMEADMENNERKKISKFVVVIVFLIGLVLILLSVIPRKPLNEEPLKTILISVGCSDTGRHSK